MSGDKDKPSPLEESQGLNQSASLPHLAAAPGPTKLDPLPVAAPSSFKLCASTMETSPDRRLLAGEQEDLPFREPIKGTGLRFRDSIQPVGVLHARDVVLPACGS